MYHLMALSILTLSAFSLFSTWYLLCLVMDLFGLHGFQNIWSVLFFWNHLWDFGVMFWAVYLVEMESVALDNSAVKHS